MPEKAPPPWRRPAAVGVDDDLASREAGVGLRARQLEAPARIGEEPVAVGVEPRRELRDDDVLAQVVGQLVEIGVLGVLGGDDHGRELDGPAVLVAHAHLGLAVRPEVRDRPGLAHLGQAASQPVRQPDRQRHEVGGLVAGVAEHHPLVACSLGVQGVLARGPAAYLEGGRDAAVDLGRLLVYRHEHTAGVPVEAELFPVVADVTDRPPREAGDVDIGARRDLAGHDHEPGCEQRLAGDAALGVLLQDGVQDGVGDLVGHLVGVAFGDRLGGEQEAAQRSSSSFSMATVLSDPDAGTAAPFRSWPSAPEKARAPAAAGPGSNGRVAHRTALATSCLDRSGISVRSPRDGRS